VCCVLPAILVTIGAGAALAGLVTLLPQLIWLSEHKLLVFGVAAALLMASGASIWYVRALPCPVEPIAARLCLRLRRLSLVLFGIAVASFALGVTFAFVLPKLNV